MKKLFISILMISLLSSVNLTAQLSPSHRSEAPPINSYNNFQRGMYVDCSAEIITDIANGNPLGLSQQLSDYILNNYIGYIILCDLENANVFNTPVLENALRTFIVNTKNSFPGIQIGLSGNREAFNLSTPSIKVDNIIKCFPAGPFNSLTDVKNLLQNSTGTTSGFKAAELCKFFLRATKFSRKSATLYKPSRCLASFDAFYLENRFWDQTSSMIVMQDEFSQFTNELKFLRMMKCYFPCIKYIDAEFLPTDIFKLQAWTSIDQITDADPLIDRIMIPAFTNSADGAFDLICKTLHYLSDQFSKSKTEIFVSLNAESSAFSYCNSTNTPMDYLGDYLNGTTVSSGNMHSVEQTFLNKYNDAQYFCSACSCYPFDDNHYTSLNTTGNILAGSMWRPYSMLLSNNLTRTITPSQLEIATKFPVLIELIDMRGKTVGRYYSIEVMIESEKNLPGGIYMQRTFFNTGEVEFVKRFVK